MSESTKQKLTDNELKKDWFKKRFGPIMAKIKIITATLQIVSSSSSALQIKFPAVFENFIGGLSIFNFNFIQVLPLSCSFHNDYVSTLIVATLWPLFVAAIMFIICVIESVYCRMQIDSNPAFVRSRGYQKYLLRRKLQFRYFSLFLLLTYFILPSITTTIFGMYPCMNVDPENEDSSPDWYLIADYSISCSSNRYYFGVTWATIFIFVYPLGIPFLYAYLLYQKKDTLDPRLTENADNGEIIRIERDDTTLSQGTKLLEFLYKSYKPRYYYFEVIETVRRLSLTAVISVIGAGTSSQAVAAIILSFMFLEIFSSCDPYKEKQDAVLSKAGQFQVFFTFQGALISRNNLLGKGADPFVGIVLILMNMSVFILTFYYEIKDAYEESKEGNNLTDDKMKTGSINADDRNDDMEKVEVELHSLTDDKMKTGSINVDDRNDEMEKVEVELHSLTDDKMKTGSINVDDRNDEMEKVEVELHSLNTIATLSASSMTSEERPQFTEVMNPMASVTDDEDDNGIISSLTSPLPPATTHLEPSNNPCKNGGTDTWMSSLSSTMRTRVDEVDSDDEL